jgi:hypothetical protein
MSGLSVGPRCGGAPGGLAVSSPVGGSASNTGEPQPPALERGQAMRQRHQVPTWQCTMGPHPVFRCVSHDLVPIAATVVPARPGITISRSGAQGMMLAQRASSAPVRTHLVGQIPASRNSSGGSR